MAKLAAYKVTSNPAPEQLIKNGYIEVDRISEIRGVDTASVVYPVAASTTASGAVTLNSGDEVTIYKYDNRNGLVAYWKLDEAVGSAVYDDTANGYGGMLFGSPTWVNGKVKTALNFNGSNYVLMNSVVITGGMFSVSAWFKTLSFGLEMICSESSGVNPIWYIGIDATGHATMNVTDSAAVALNVTGSVNYSDGNWHHFLATFNSSSSPQGIVYIDGVSVASGSATFTGNFNFATKFQISGNNGGAFAPFFGTIDEVRVYNRVITSVEVLELYNFGKFNLMDTWWTELVMPCNEISDVNVFDQSNRANHGTIVAGEAGLWKFDEFDPSSISALPSTALDSSTNGRNATINGTPSKAVGRFGNALQFNTGSQFLSVANNIFLNPTSVETVTAWIKFPTFGSNNFYTIWTGGADEHHGLKFAIDNRNGGSKFWCEVGDGNALNFDTYNPSLPSNISDGNWHFIALVATPPSASIYFDGTLFASGNFANNPASITADTASEYIAAWFGGGQVTSGNPAYLLDEVRVFGRALSSTEVNNLYLQNITSLRKLGNYGKALSFDGSNVYVACGTALVVPSARLAVAAWVNTAVATGLYRGIIAKTTGGGATQQVFSLDWTSTGVLEFVIGSATTTDSVTFSWSPTLNAWYHVAGTYDGATLRLYINGVQVASAASTLSIQQQNYTTYIGSAYGAGVNLWNGMISDVTVWSKTLDSNEIAILSSVQPTMITAFDSNSRLFDGIVVARDYQKLQIKATLQSKRTFVSKLWIDNVIYSQTASQEIIRDMILRNNTSLGWKNVGTDQVFRITNPAPPNAVNVGASSDFLVSNFTFVLIMRIPALPPSGTVTLIGVDGTASSYGIQLTSAGAISVYYKYSSTLTHSLTSSVTVAANTFYRVIGTFDGSYLRIWVNGIMDYAAFTDAIFTDVNPSVNICEGAAVTITYDVSEFALYNRALSMGEANTINRGFAISNGKKLWFLVSGVSQTFKGGSGGSGNAWQDYSGLGHTGFYATGAQTSLVTSGNVIVSFTATGNILDLMNKLTQDNNADYQEDGYGSIQYFASLINSNLVFYIGSESGADKLIRDDTNYANEILVKGGTTYLNVATFTGTGNGTNTKYYLDSVYQSVISITDNGSTIPPANYTVVLSDSGSSPPSTSVTFTTAPASGHALVFTAGRNYGNVIGTAVDSAAQTAPPVGQGRRMKIVQDSSIQDTTTANNYAAALLAVYERFPWVGSIQQGGIRRDVERQLVRLIDPIRGIDTTVQVTELKIRYPQGSDTTYAVGSWIPISFDWGRDITSRVRELMGR